MQLNVDKSNASSISFTHYINENLQNHLVDFAKQNPEHAHLSTKEQNGFEGDTLQLLYTDISSLDDDYKVLYLHSKGASNKGAFYIWDSRESWRKSMSDCVISNWKTCFECLELENHTGTHYFGGYQANCIPHYSGNFWWTKSSYIKTLVSFEKFCEKDFVVNKVIDKLKHHAGHEHFLTFLRCPFYLSEYWITHGEKAKVIF